MSERPAVISLGAGVQSSALLLMAAEGRFGPPPELAIFADTQGEPSEVYTYLSYLRRTVGERIQIVEGTAGDLRQDILDTVGGEKNRVSSPPLYLINEDGTHGFSLRKCTRDYKVRVVERTARAHGYGPKNPIDSWQGISLDEVERMKENKTSWVTNRYPLVEEGLTRHACQQWLVDNGHPAAPKSACFYCPYQSNARWRRLRDESPDEWNAAVELDRAVRHMPGMKGEGYLHAQRVPLDEVDLSTAEDRGQLTFASECEGMCGV